MHHESKKHGKRWKLALVLLVAGFQIALAATMVVAARRVAPVTDAEYYQHGLQYGKTSSGEKNPGVNWTLSAALVGGELQVQVRDEAGAPVTGGTLRFEPRRPVTGTNTPLMLAESAAGTFRAPQPSSPTGELQGTLHFSLGEATATQKLVLFN